MGTIKSIFDIAMLLFAVVGFLMTVGFFILVGLIKRGATVTFSYNDDEEEPDE